MKKVVVAFVAMVFCVRRAGRRQTVLYGLYTSIGQHQSGGDFTLSHHGSKFSFGEILDVQLSGDITTYEVGYRFPLGDSRLRLGVNATLHDGAIGGSKTWEILGAATTTFAAASDLRLSVGGEIGAVLGKRERVYVYAGAGMVATDLVAGLAIDTPWGNWSIKGRRCRWYHLPRGRPVPSERSSVLLVSASQMEFDATQSLRVW